MANLMPQIAQMLGVETGEEFEIEGYKGLIYQFTDDELIVRSENDPESVYTTANMTLVSLLRGKREIVKLPWKPKNGDVYYTFIRDRIDRKCTLVSYRWDGCVIDIALLDKGWVYRTEAEAEAALPKVAAEFDAKYKL